MESSKLKNIVEAALLAAGEPLTIDQLRTLFGDGDDDQPEKQEIRAVLQALNEDYADRAMEIREVASGFRVQVRDAMSPWLLKLWEDRPPRYSRALMETLAIIAYRQPVTRGDVEEIRGVTVTTNIIRTLLERNWIKVVGQRDVPGKPALFGTTREFLDYFGLKKLDELPPLAELAEMEPMGLQLQLQEAGAEQGDIPDALPGEAEEITDAPQVADAAGDEIVAQSEDSDGVLDAGIADDLDDDADDEVSDAELAAAMEATKISIDDINSGFGDVEDSGHDADADDDTGSVDVPPGAVAPLVSMLGGSEEVEPASVASLDDARAAAADKRVREAAPPDDADENESSAGDVVPLKNS